MTKLSAVEKLIAGECDILIHGKSEFVLLNGAVVNKKSKKPMEMKDLMEEGWVCKSLPKWYDKLISGEVKFVLAKAFGDPVVVDKAEAEEAIKNGTISEYVPMTLDDAKEIIVAEGKKPVRRKRKNKSEAANEKKEDKEVDTQSESSSCEEEHLTKPEKPMANQEEHNEQEDVIDAGSCVANAVGMSEKEDVSTDEEVGEEPPFDVTEDLSQSKSSENTALQKDDVGDKMTQVKNRLVSLGLNEEDFEEFIEHMKISFDVEPDSYLEDEESVIKEDIEGYYTQFPKE